MADMRLAVGGRRTVVKSVRLMALVFFNRFFKDLVFLPERKDLLLPRDEVQVGRYFLIAGHFKPPLSIVNPE
ncbi:hypothetical protein SDC9_207724 [bioreactor metagenome]|uniref:Uncharacterized protein n=1 Tax=bioreactor metagenome TaxID=1076179 RepID=A0A645J8N5_9ZZZZ